MLVVDNDVGRADVNGKGSHTEVRGFARKLRMDIWKKLFGITGGVRPATELNEAIEQPGKPASWRAIQQRAQKNAELYEKAFPWVPRSWTGRLDRSGNPIAASVLPTWNEQERAPAGSKWGELGRLMSPMPFQKEFWGAPRHDPAGVAGLNQIKGFITAFPIMWTKGENNHFPYPTNLVADGEIPASADPTKPTTQTAQAARPTDVETTESHVG